MFEIEKEFRIQFSENIWLTMWNVGKKDLNAQAGKKSVKREERINNHYTHPQWQ